MAAAAFTMVATDADARAGGGGGPGGGGRGGGGGGGGFVSHGGGGGGFVSRGGGGFVSRGGGGFVSRGGGGFVTRSFASPGGGGFVTRSANVARFSHRPFVRRHFRRGPVFAVGPDFTTYDYGYYDDCVVPERVLTNYGWRVMLVNACDY
jgi:hypothetical protein